MAFVFVRQKLADEYLISICFTNCLVTFAIWGI
jgi:hypothetical protein